MLNALRRNASWIAPLLLLTALAACGDSPTEDDEPEPEFTTVRLMIGTQTVTINRANGAVTGTATIPRNTAVPISATFLLASGAADPVVDPNEFQLRVPTTTSGVTFVRTGPFAGTITAATAGAAAVTVELFAIEHNHSEFSGVVPLTVQQ